MKRPLYFAYGSNLDAGQMRRRCPGSASAGPAKLKGWRLAFGGYSRAWGGPVATLLRRADEQVDGLLYSVSPDELSALDRYEGHPSCYRRRILLVTDQIGRRRRAHVYVLSIADEAPPAADYLAVLRRAYRRLGFDRRSLAAAAGGVR